MAATTVSSGVIARLSVGIMRVAMSISLCFLLLGCNQDVLTVPPDTLGIELTVTRSPTVGSVTSPVTITARVNNRGVSTRICFSGCDYLITGIAFRIYDPYFQEVFLYNPTTWPHCANYRVSFHPGEKIQGAFTFDGTLYDVRGDTLTMGGGTYTVLIEFTSWAEENPSDTNRLDVEKLITFDWKTGG